MHQQLLKNIQSRIALTAEEQDAFPGFWKERSLKRHEFLLRNGTVCNYDSYVISGSFKAYYIHPETGREEILFFAIKDWWATDLDSFARQTPSIYNIRALEPAMVLQIHKDAFEQLLIRIPGLELYFRLILQGYMAAIQQRLVFINAFSAEKRYHAFAAKYPELLQKIPLYLIASYLGITPEFLSRIRAKKSGTGY